MAALEEGTERNGYALFTAELADFIPARMVDVAAAQSMLLRSREASTRTRHMFAKLPFTENVDDGIRVSEYFLRWHQSNGLTVVNEKRLSNIFRNRALELPFVSRYAGTPEIRALREFVDDGQGVAFSTMAV